MLTKQFEAMFRETKDLFCLRPGQSAAIPVSLKSLNERSSERRMHFWEPIIEESSFDCFMLNWLPLRFRFSTPWSVLNTSQMDFSASWSILQFERLSVLIPCLFHLLKL